MALALDNKNDRRNGNQALSEGLEALRMPSASRERELDVVGGLTMPKVPGREMSIGNRPAAAMHSVETTPVSMQKTSEDREGPGAFATVGQKLSHDIENVWRQGKTDGGFVKLAKTIGRIFLDLFRK